MAKHSMVSPSKAEQFFNCPGCLREEAKIKIKEPPSPYAMEGSALHEFVALILEKDGNPEDYRGQQVTMTQFGITEVYTIGDEWIYAANMYKEKVYGDLAKHGLNYKSLKIESKVRIPEVDPAASGTVDCYFVGGTTLYCYDFKGGRGVAVSPNENKQCMYYALRPTIDLQAFILGVNIVIVQPLCREDGGVKEWSTTPERLMQFKDELIDAIARTRNPNAPLAAGKWCRWCKALGACPANNKLAMTTAQEIIPQIDRVFPALTEITPEQLGKGLPALDMLKRIFEKLEQHAFTLACDGVEIPNYTLSRGRGNRRYICEDDVVAEFGKEYADRMYDKKLKTPAQLEKVVGKKELEPFTEKPEGALKLKLVKELDEDINKRAQEIFAGVDVSSKK